MSNDVIQAGGQRLLPILSRAPHDYYRDLNGNQRKAVDSLEARGFVTYEGNVVLLTDRAWRWLRGITC